MCAIGLVRILFIVSAIVGVTAAGFTAAAHAQGSARADARAKADAQRAADDCDGAAWEAAANAYKASHPELAGPFGLVALPGDFPSYPFPCTKKLAAAPRTAGGFRTAETAPPRPADRVFVASNYFDSAPGAFYAGGSVGGSYSSHERTLPSLITLNIVDPTDGRTYNGNSTYFSGGLFMGMNIAQFFGWLFGVEAGYDWMDKNEAFLGNVPNTTLGPNTDRMATTRNSLLTVSGLVTIPVNPNFSVFTRFGWARSNEDVTIDCNSSCDAAGTPRFRSVQSADFNGWVWGVGAQGRIGRVGMFPVLLRGEYQHYSFGGKTFGAGNPANAAIGFHTEPEIDMVKGSLVVPLWNQPAVWASDIRLKRDIVRVGALDNGLALYRYKYRDSEREYVGVMAQEVAAVMPDAVQQGDDGYLRVDYGKLGIRLQTFDEYQWTHAPATLQAAWRPLPVMAGWPGEPPARSCRAPQQAFSAIVAALPDTLPVVR